MTAIDGIKGLVRLTVVCLIGTVVSASATEEFNADAAQSLLKRGIQKLVFTKRYTITSTHVYTEYVDSKWTPGGNICVLDLKTGKTTELTKQLEDGVFNRFDISYDAKKIVFDWKEDAHVGYRIFEMNIDGTGLRQLTFPQKDENDLVAKYGNRRYHHGTDDMHPCYLPDGGIVFTSTRCQFGILCNSPDIFTTKVLYRMDGDGRNMKRLSNSSVSEASPAMLPDGRIVYHRWEYVDKAAGNAKCLWSMRPDGTASAEVYGNTLTQPETLIYPRPIPGAPNKIVTLGTTHCCPNNAMGTVLIIDTTKNIHTREPMTYVTKDIDARTHTGFHFLINGKWVYDKQGSLGRLFKDPYPISESLFIATRKPKGPKWNDPKAYDLVLLDGEGKEKPLFRDTEISCWHPYPLKPRKRPPVSLSPINKELAQKKVAACVVTDVYEGLEGVSRGTIKFIRIMEQVPRSWQARTRWGGDRDGMAHTALGLGILGMKTQRGIVPVEEDGSAYFLVPASRNIYFQVLDKDYMSVQTERTYVNYMPGETRSCVGCHELPNEAPAPRGRGTVLALKRAPSIPGPQPGETRGGKLLDYAKHVQPVWDKHCISCHNPKDNKGKLDLSGTPTKLWSVSYENLIKLRRMNPYFARNANENTGSYSIAFLKPYMLGSHTSILPTILSHGRIKIKNNPKMAERAAKLVEKHKKINVTQEEFIKVANWLDSSCQFHASYWGKKNVAYKDDPFYRPNITFEDAISYTIPESLKVCYTQPQRTVTPNRRVKLSPSMFDKKKKVFGNVISTKAKVEVSTSSKWDPKRYKQFVGNGDPGSFAFHTDEEKNPWVQLDLGAVKDIKGVLIENRADLIERAKDLSVQLSTDGEQWTSVWQATKPKLRWEVPIPTTGNAKTYGRPARYIRLVVAGNERTYLHLRGVRVYGK